MAVRTKSGTAGRGRSWLSPRASRVPRMPYQRVTLRVASSTRGTVMRRGVARAALSAAAIVTAGVAVVAVQQVQQAQPQQQRLPVFRGEAVLVTVDAYPQREGRIV